MTEEARVPVVRMEHATDLPLPVYATPSSAGMDLMAILNDPLALEPGSRALVPTGIAMALPPGLEAQVRPRSGLATRYGITVLNAPGTIDGDYRGEIGVVLFNAGGETVTFRRGDRIAQLVVAPVTRIAWEEHAELPQTVRGAGGFGSTGA